MFTTWKLSKTHFIFTHITHCVFRTFIRKHFDCGTWIYFTGDVTSCNMVYKSEHRRLGGTWSICLNFRGTNTDGKSSRVLWNIGISLSDSMVSYPKRSSWNNCVPKQNHSICARSVCCEVWTQLLGFSGEMNEVLQRIQRRGISYRQWKEGRLNGQVSSWVATAF